MADKERSMAEAGGSTGSTVNLRVKKFRSRMTQEQKNEESKRIEGIRKRRVELMSEDERDAYRKSQRDRKKQSRLKAKQSQTPATPSGSGGYKSRQAMGKAVNRLFVHLPMSPSKKEVAIQGLATRVGVNLMKNLDCAMSEKQAELQETNRIIREFFFRTDIVWTAPGMKDETTVWEGGERQRLRKYYLTVYLKEAYCMFKNLHPDISVGFSKFASLRPQNVFLLKQQPEDACKCRFHENFMHKLKGLRVSYDNNFWIEYTCDSVNLSGDCWKNVCEKCKDGQLFFSKIDVTGVDSEVYWKEWMKNESGRLFLDVHCGPVQELLQAVGNAWGTFITHVRVKRIQSDAFNANTDNCKSSVLQFDFAMAYSCQYQDEVQSALWSRASVNLFTGAFFQKGKPCKSYLIVTDNQEKNKDAVYAFVTKLVDTIGMETLSESEYLAIYTDGPTSEFKNRFIMKLLHDIQQRVQIETRWQYFATSHGKGVVDGIGGAAKSMVRIAVMSKSGRTIVQSSKDFHRVVSETMPKVTSIHLTSEDVQRSSPDWSDAKEVLGISKIHTAICQAGDISLYETNDDFKNGSIKLKLTYMDNSSTSDPPTEKLCINLRDWVVVEYDGQTYPGEVTAFRDNCVEVSVMNSSNRSTWHWPKNPDVLLYEHEHIKSKIDPPVPTGSRNLFKFASDYL